MGIDNSDWIQEALRRFSEEYADTIGNRTIILERNRKALLKFGRNVGVSSANSVTGVAEFSGLIGRLE